MAEDFEVVSGTTVISSPKRASVMAAVTTVPNDDVTRQSWSPPDRTCRFSRSDSEFNVCFPSPPPRGGAYDTKAVSFRSDSNQRFTNFEARSNLPNNSSAPPSRDICDSRPQVGQSQQRNEVPSSCRNEIVPELVPYSDVRAGPTYSTRGDLHGILKSAQPPRAVDAVVSNLPAATCMTASPFSNPVQPVFATGQRDISSCYVSNQFTASRTPVNDDVRSRRSPGTPGADQKPRVSEQYSASLSHITTASPGRIQSDPSDRHPIVDVASLKSIPQPTSLPLKAVPKPIAQNISKCTALALPVSDVFNRHSGERTNIASINHAPSPPSASSRVAADQFSPVASFFCTDSSSSSSSSALISSHPHLYQQRAFVELANIGTTQTENQPSIQSSRYSSGVCQPTVPDISDYSSAPHIRGHFGEGCRNATNYSWKQFLPSSDLISHPSTSEQPPSRTTSQNPSASTFDRNLHATSSVQLQCPTSHSDMFASIASHNSLFNSRQDGPFVAVEAKVEGKLNSFVLGEKSDTVSHRSIIEAVRRPLPTPVSMPQLKLCESYLASGSNVAPSPRIAVVNQLSIAPRQSGSQSAANCGNNELAMDSARPTALRGVDLRTGFSQFGGSDETPFSNVGPTWTSTKASDNNPSKRVQVTGVPQSSGLLFES